MCEIFESHTVSAISRSTVRRHGVSRAHVAPTIYGVSLRHAHVRALPVHTSMPSSSSSSGASDPLRAFLALSSSLPLVRLPKSRQHLASSILGETQADILSRTITVTFDHRMTGEWLTLRHQSMNFSLSARYNLQSAWRRRRRRRPSRRPDSRFARTNQTCPPSHVFPPSRSLISSR